MLPLDTDRLSIYLNDHLAGATAGLELANRVARDGSGAELLREIAREISEDRDTLIEVMARLSCRRDPLKQLASRALERAGWLKLHGGLLGYSALSRLEELELISLGVEGKLALWQALRATHADDPRLEGVDLDDLVARARSQRRRLERPRRRAAEEALI